MKEVYATLPDDFRREATGCARRRLDVLAETGRVLTKVFFMRCPSPFYDCPKCGLLMRVMARITEEQDELLGALKAAGMPG